MNNQVNIKSFQIRAARSILGIGVREVGQCLSVSGAAVSLWENTLDHLHIRTSNMNIILLIKFFEQRDVFFPDENTITLNPALRYSTSNQLTRFQLRAGRSILNISQMELAHHTGVSAQLITRAESLDNNIFIRPKEVGATIKIRNWLESKGITFPNDLTVSFKLTLRKSIICA